jgi:hypothetical protein
MIAFRDAIIKAFKYWSDASHLKFVEVPKGKQSDMAISFEEGYNKANIKY